MTVMIVEVGAPVRISQQPAVVVAVGGGVVGDAWSASGMQLRCQACGKPYPLAESPRALALSFFGAQVLPGYVEWCPHEDCRHEHQPGTVLEVV